MAVAARLKVRGHEVTILEQSAIPGGKVGVLRRDGFVFDTGPSLLTLPAVYRDLFLKTGSALEDTVDLQPVEPGTSYTWADGTTAHLPGVSTARAANVLGDALGGSAGTDWRALMTRAGKVWQLTRRPVLESPIAGPRDLLKLMSSVADARTVAPLQTLHGLGLRQLKDPRLRMLLDRYATYTGSDPRRAPAALITVPYVEQTFGSWHIGGGLNQLVDALYHRCLERGVDVAFNQDVARVTTEAGRVTGVELADGSPHLADVVISNADARYLYQDLFADPLAKGPLRRLRRITPSFSGFVMMLAVRGRTPGLAHHNVWFPGDYDGEFTSVFGGRPPSDPAIYACVPDDSAMRPDADHESWFILVNAPRHGHARHEYDWDATGVADSYADRILNLLAERNTDLRDRIIWRELRTPADLERETRAPGGSIYGSSSNGPRAAFLRPANASPIGGLYLVGGSAHPGGGLPLVGMSAEIVSNLIGRADR